MAFEKYKPRGLFSEFYGIQLKTIEIHSTTSKLKKVRLKIALTVCKFGISRSSRGRAFHNLGAATWKDLSPSVALALNVDGG